MAMNPFFFGRELGESLSQIGEEEVRIVAESARTPRPGNHDALGGVAKARQRAAVARQCDHANVAGSPPFRRQTGESVKKLGVVRGVGCVYSRVSRRVSRG